MNRQLYDRFDIPVNRVGTESLKWDARADFGNPDALPMWVADMDFRTADAIVDALIARTQHGIFGYSLGEDLDKQVTAQWMKTRHGCAIKTDWLLPCPGVVDGIYHILSALLPEGARVVIQTPVYGPFHSMTRKANMCLVENPLRDTGKNWEMDFEGLEGILRAGADALILCSPHNPVGRVWRADELTRLLDLCHRYGVTLISDEIHADFELRGARHTPIHALPYGDEAISLISATKTFNLAALRHSNIICPDAEKRAKIASHLQKVMAEANLYGRLATRAAYQGGAEWLDALLEYLSDGRDILLSGINAIPGLHAYAPEGTYLMWVNCADLRLEGDALKAFFTEKCGVLPTGGDFFGAQGSRFVRLNFATTHANIRLALQRIAKAVREA